MLKITIEGEQGSGKGVLARDIADLIQGTYKPYQTPTQVRIEDESGFVEQVTAGKPDVFILIKEAPYEG